MPDIRQLLREHLLAKHLPGEDPANLTDETALRTDGILDSVATLELVTFVEQRFGIELEAHETSVEHFDRLGDIVALIERKKGS